MGRPVISVNKREIPVAPPSMKSFGKRKLFNPNPADNIPITMSRESLRFKINAFRVRYCDFASWYLLGFTGDSCLFFFSLTTVCDIN